jgi:hypothetical protein
VAQVQQRWRAGQIRSIAGAATIRLHAEANIIRDYTGISTSLLPAGAIVGDAITERVTGSFPYVVSEIRSSCSHRPAVRSGCVRRLRPVLAGRNSYVRRSTSRFLVVSLNRSVRF